MADSNGVTKTANYVVMPRPLAEAIVGEAATLERRVNELRARLDSTNTLLLTALTEMAQGMHVSPRLFVLRWLQEHRRFEE